MSEFPVAPGEVVRQKLKDRGWTQDDLALVIGRSVKTVSDLVRGKSGLTPDLATALAGAFQESAVEWMAYDSSYKLALVKSDLSEIQKRSQLFTKAPVRDMQKRGWIRQTDDSGELDKALRVFFDSGQMSPVSLRRAEVLPTLNPSESAWCHRARALARTLLLTKPFSSEKFTRSRASFKKLASHPKECRFIAEHLADLGVRFVVVEPLPNVKIDGATFWDEFGPVVALSIRYDRIDWFWFTLMHELSHVVHGDPLSIDTDLIGEEGCISSTGNEVEQRANAEAATSLIPADEMKSFKRRVGPLYSKVRIIQFANRMKIHPGVIVGQLQHSGEIGFSSMREYLVKVRDIVVSTTLTDGWGQIITPVLEGKRS